MFVPLLYNERSFCLVIIVGLFLSWLDKRSHFFWIFFLPQLIYFSLISKPTEHLYNFLNFIVILSGLGLSYFIKFFSKKIFFIRSIFYPILFGIGILNAFFIVNTKEINSLSLKSTAYLVRKNTNICDKIFTDIEGHTARLYFGRRYTLNPQEAKIIVLDKDMRLDRNNVLLFNKQYSSFKNLMPYLQCPN